MVSLDVDRVAARQEKLDEVHARLERAVGELVSGEDWLRALAFSAKFRSRSFSNTLLIFAQHFDAYEKGRVPEPFPTLVAGFKQWQALGRNVMRGQHGYAILAPVTARYASDNPDQYLGRRLGFKEKPEPGEVVSHRMVGVKPAYVWDVSQTEGDPIPKLPTPTLLQGEAPAGLWDGLAAQVGAEGFDLVRVDSAGVIDGANGMTDYAARTVSVRTDMDDAAQVKTLAHELGHVLLHNPEVDMRDHHRGVREVEAETEAMMVGAAHGLDTLGYTVPYVASWASGEKKSEIEIVRATGEKVRGCANRILDALDTMQVFGGDVSELTPAGRTQGPSQAGRTRHRPPQAGRAGVSSGPVFAGYEPVGGVPVLAGLGV